jgi:exopolyphosphatase/guanosine-5'-triphosphate,3'-diphosphate pyrophosphatase
MKIASIDVGSNTVILLIAEVDQNIKTIKSVYDLQFIPRISEGLNETKLISEAKVFELLQILLHYKEVAKNYNCTSVNAFGTNAFRIASNSQDVINRIKEESVITIEVLSGELEAEYSFIGATYESFSSMNALVIDIGGGSTEISLGKNCKIRNKISLPIGVVSLKEKFFNGHPENYNLTGAYKETKKYLKNIDFTGIDIDIAIAIAGTPTTLASIKKRLNVYDEQAVEGDELEFSDINCFINELSKLKSEEILNKYQTVVSNREDLLLPGSVLLYKIMSYFKLNKVIVSTKGLRYGVIIKRYFYDF